MSYIAYTVIHIPIWTADKIEYNAPNKNCSNITHLFQYQDMILDKHIHDLILHKMTILQMKLQSNNNNAQGCHAMVCKKAPGKIARHQVLNDVIWWALNAAWIPATKEPSGLNRQDGKRPNGLTLIPWQDGKPLIWDVTVASTLAASYADIAATDAGLLANQAADRKADKYADFTASYIFEHIVVENLGPLSASVLVESLCISVVQSHRDHNLKIFLDDATNV